MIFKLIQKARGNDPARAAIDLGRYIARPETEDGAEKCHWLCAYNCMGSPEDVLEELRMAAVPASVGKRLRTTGSGLEHCVISWPENETPSAADMDFTARSFIATFGPCALCLAGTHVNTENLHLHLAVQRFGPFGELLAGNPKQMLRWHATLAVMERNMGFMPEANPLVAVEPLLGGQYRVTRKKRERSVQTLRPVSPELLPIIESSPPPGLRRRGNLLWIPECRTPALYIARNFLVVLHWQLPQVVRLVQGINAPVHNVRNSDSVRAAEILSMEEVPAPEIHRRRRTSAQSDFRRLLGEEHVGHQSAREENAARGMLDMGYDEDGVGEALERWSKMPEDCMRALHVTRALKSALRPVNRFRRLARFGVRGHGPDRMWERWNTADIRMIKKAAKKERLSGKLEKK